MSPAKPTSEWLELASLGATPQAALRNLAEEFERRGWKDESAGALAVIRLLEDGGGSAPWGKAAMAVPSVFLSANRVLRRDLETALRAAASRR